MTEPPNHAPAEAPATLDRVLLDAWGSFAIVFVVIAVVDTMVLVRRAGMSAGELGRWAPNLGLALASGFWVAGALSFTVVLAHVPRVRRPSQFPRWWVGGICGLAVGIMAAVSIRPWLMLSDPYKIPLTVPILGMVVGAAVGACWSLVGKGAASVLLGAGAVAAFVVDVSLFRHLYPTLHAALFYLAAQLGMLALYLHRGPTLRRVALLAVVLVAVGHMLMLRDLEVETSLAFRHGAATPKQIGALRLLVDFDRDGYSSLFGGGDCSDFDENVRPGGCEVPRNGRDDNCNGLVDGDGDGEAGGGETRVDPVVGTPGAGLFPEGRPLPDVYFVVVDTMRADMGRTSSRAALAPRLDQFAAGALDMARAYTPYPSTYRAMRAFMQSRAWRYVTAGDDSLMSHLVRHGYDAQLWVDERRLPWTLEDPPLGPDRSTSDPFELSDHEDKGAWTAGLVDDALAELAPTAAAPEPGPRARWIHILDPHVPLVRRPGATLIERYRAEIAHVDEQFGRLLDGLAASTRGRRAVVILLADHGDEYGEHGGRYHGGTLFEEVTHVPLVMRFPGVAPLRVDAPASLLDVPPTIARYLGLPSLPGWQGRDWLEDQPPRDRPEWALRVLSETEPVDNLGGMGLPARHMVTDGRHKLVANIDDNLLELYDLRSDPAERISLIGRGLPIESALRQRLRQWQDLPGCRR